MTRLSKDFRAITQPDAWNKFLQPLKHNLEQIMNDCGANHYSKHFFGQTHLKSLALFQMSEGKSLNDLHVLLNHDIRFKLFSQCSSISKSQLSRSNARRNVVAFDTVFQQLMSSIPSRLLKNSFLSKKLNGIRIFDGTHLQLNPNFFPWAIYRHQNSFPDAGIRMTIRINMASQAPEHVVMHSGNDNSANYFEHSINFNEKGYLYLFDREYNKHATFDKIAQSGNFFITRMKKDARYSIITEKRIPSRKENNTKIIRDTIIFLGKKKAHKVSVPLRRIELIDAKGKKIVFLTNILAYGASHIAETYRKQWDIELFFKWIKQHLKIKQFISHSVNGILLQIYSALIVYVLLILFKYTHKISMSLFDIQRRIKASSSMISPVLLLFDEKLKFSNQLSKNMAQRLTAMPFF